MDMELSAGEFSDHSQIIRRKRSKRKRPSSNSPPFNCAPAVTSRYSSGGAGGDSGGNCFSTQYSPATSTDVSAANEEELEEMADCLIMLAESLSNKSNHHHDYSEKVISRRLDDTATAGKSSDSSLYECKTCNRTFPSFQALGGHRASHTKPNKVVPVSLPPEEIGTKALVLPKLLTEKVNELTKAKVNSASTVQLPPPLSFLIESGNSTRASSKVHECSICGAVFSSGQALGGHMRRHRIMPAPINKTTAMSPSSPLSPTMMGTNSGDQTETSEENGGGRSREMILVDLNLPAPEYDQEENTFQFMSSTQAQQPVFTQFPGYG